MNALPLEDKRNFIGRFKCWRRRNDYRWLKGKATRFYRKYDHFEQITRSTARLFAKSEKEVIAKPSKLGLGPERRIVWRAIEILAVC